MMSHNRTVSLGVDYFINNSKERKASRTDIEAVGLLKHKVKSKVAENGKAILKGDTMQSVMSGCSKFLRTKYREPEGAPVDRIMKQLGDIAEVIYRELEVGVRNPEGACDWLGKKRRALRTSGMFLTDREMYI